VADSRLRVEVVARPGDAAGLARWIRLVAPARAKGSLTIALVSDARVRALNRRYRRKDRATDVLSFPAADLHPAGQGPTPGAPEPRAAARGGREPQFLGDLVIARGVARRQASEVGHSYATELRVLALHGFLHLLGYDHDDPQDRGRMARAEARLRHRGGLREGLISRAQAERVRP
jgi:probable rRNA maturation factor